MAPSGAALRDEASLIALPFWTGIYRPKAGFPNTLEPAAQPTPQVPNWVNLAQGGGPRPSRLPMVRRPREPKACSFLRHAKTARPPVRRGRRLAFLRHAKTARPRRGSASRTMGLTLRDAAKARPSG